MLSSIVKSFSEACSSGVENIRTFMYSASNFIHPDGDNEQGTMVSRHTGRVQRANNRHHHGKGELALFKFSPCLTVALNS